MLDSDITVTTIDQTTSVEDIIKEQYLAANLDEMVELQKFAEKNKFKADIVWRNVFLFVGLHFGALIGLYQFIFLAKWPTIIWTLLPTFIPIYLWKEKAYLAFYTAVVFRYTFTLHATWFINSVAHMFGYRPYDVNITPTESIWTTVSALGEGGHNYHHTFPQDYRTSEMKYLFNWTRFFIDQFAKIGWAYDMKTVDPATIQRQKEKQVISKEKAH